MRISDWSSDVCSSDLKPAAAPQAATAAGDGRATCVLVLGMHRSGTSALTRVLNLLGVALGRQLMQAAAGNNETGLWEHQDAVDAHEALLSAFAMRCSDPRRLPDGWEETPPADTARAAILTTLAAPVHRAPLRGVNEQRRSQE